MVTVKKITEKGERIMTFSDEMWKRIVDNPKLLPYKWELVTKAKSPPVVKAAPKEVVAYGDEEYASDIALVKRLLREGKNAEAKPILKRANAYKSNPYWVGKLKKL
jgi:hypothetical protein